MNCSRVLFPQLDIPSLPNPTNQKRPRLAWSRGHTLAPHAMYLFRFDLALWSSRPANQYQMTAHQQQQRKYRWFGAARLSRAYFAVLLVLSLTEIALPILGIREAYLKEEFPATPNGKLVESELAVAQSCPGYAGMNIAAFIVAVLRFPVIVASFKYDSMAPKDYSVPAMDGAAIAADVGVWWKRSVYLHFHVFDCDCSPSQYYLQSSASVECRVHCAHRCLQHCLCCGYNIFVHLDFHLSD
ncbi:hypothetical protein BC828DRAFT_173814 [Blastocladiella britannica]|nr:hypothetical protein BC828DRAFT_173814 [Blastocladiella britannica]